MILRLSGSQLLLKPPHILLFTEFYNPVQIVKHTAEKVITWTYIVNHISDINAKNAYKDLAHATYETQEEVINTVGNQVKFECH